MERTSETRSAAPEATGPSGRPPAEPRPRRVVAKRPRKRRGVVVTDPVGDMLTRVRNAIGARHETVEIPTSRLKAEVARLLRAEGFIAGYEVSGAQLVLRLKYLGKAAALTGIDRVSRPGRRVYARRGEMPRVLGGLGIAIVSTSAGLMTGTDARRKGLGGEVLAKVW